MVFRTAYVDGPLMSMMRSWSSVGVDGPQRHLCARMRSLKITFEGAVHGQTSTNRHRHVEERFPTARGRREGTDRVAQASAAARIPGVSGQAGSDFDRARGVGRFALVGE